MRKGIKITLQGASQSKGFRSYIQESATALNLEGYLQGSSGNQATIYAVGDSDSVESLVDKIYACKKSEEIEQIVVVPIDTDRDFRGVFRVVCN